jgi:hypothetical protein
LAQITGLFSMPTEDDAFAQQQAGAVIEGDVDVITVVATLGGDGRFGFPSESGSRGDVDAGSHDRCIRMLTGEQESGAHFAQKKSGAGGNVDLQLELVATEGTGSPSDQVHLRSAAPGKHFARRSASDAQQERWFAAQRMDAGAGRSVGPKSGSGGETGMSADGVACTALSRAHGRHRVEGSGAVASW